MFYIYLWGYFLFQGLAAWRIPDTGFRTILLVSIFWPVFCPLIILGAILPRINLDFDIISSDKLFSIRKPKNPEVKWGYAVSLLYKEFQIWKTPVNK